MTASSAAATRPVLRECHGCGLLQTVPPLNVGETARCGRCGSTLRRARTATLDRSLALTGAALILLTVLSTNVLMRVSAAGTTLRVGLFGGPQELVDRGMPELAIAVAFTVFFAPLWVLLCRFYVLLRLRERPPPEHLRDVFRLAERMRPWSMLEVFLFGVFVAYTKLAGLVTIGLGPGVYALGALTFVLIWAEDTLDRSAVWDALDAEDEARADGRSWTAQGVSGCETCGLVSRVFSHEKAHCRRCHAPLHPRKPSSISRTWALVIASAILYVPANTYPVLTVMQLGAGQPSTILGGVEELYASRMYPLAALVFCASVAVPLLKLVGLSVLLTATQTGRMQWLRDSTRLYRVICVIGRWSMIDIFMESLLGALVKFGKVITIEPGVGAVSFCAVVLLTILAAEGFDPRMMWDAAGRNAVSAVRAG
ncbi:MAG TPA: paraquat-inducible protein A [Acetobacteraceae bacterium]|nr:paraquat-inducible protein A [Acetobacteraceae bacterium]